MTKNQDKKSEKPTREKQSPLKKRRLFPVIKVTRRKLLFLTSISVLILLGGATTAYAFHVSNRILPHTVIAGVSVGGLTKDAARAKLEEKQAAFKGSDLAFNYEGKDWQVPASDLALEFDNAPALQAAYGAGKTGGVSQQMKDFFRSFFVKRYLETDLKPLSDAGKDALHKKALADIEVNVSETTLEFIPGSVRVTPGTAGKKVQLDKVDEDIYKAFKNGTNSVPLELTTFAPEVTAEMAEPAKEQADLILAKSWFVSAGDTRITLDPQEIKGWLGTEVARDTDGQATGLNITLQGDVIKSKVSELSKSVDREPANAQFAASDGGLSVIQPDKDGQALDVDATFEKLKEALLKSADGDHIVTAEVKITKADLRSDTLESLGIKELIGTATTDFTGSPANRTFNIKKGQSMLNGSLVKDGETFSTIAKLAPIEESNGWKSELVIKGNRTLPEAGGGLCQVSTTLFRAVLNAGLPIVERTNHSYRVGYYERETGPGLDATIYEPKPDFKWKNDTGHAVYVQSSIKGNKITFDLYGTKDGRVSDVPKPTITEVIKVGAPIYSETDTLPKGTTKQIETAHDGAKTTVTYTVTRNGEVINQQTFNSYYQPWPAQYLVGTKE